MTNDLDTLLTALYVKVDDELEASRWMGRPPQLTDAELVTLAVALGAARPPFRDALVAVRAHALGRDVPVPAAAVRVQ